MSIAEPMPPYTRLLLDERPLQILPGLATAIGLNESIVLQQLHYWMMNTKSGEYHEGKKWVYNTYEQWHENFPFWSVMTIRRIIGKLEETGMIETTDKFNRDTRDRTKWYTINYGHEKLTSGVINMNSSTDCSDRTGHMINMNKSSVEQRLPTETTAETTVSANAKSPEPPANFSVPEKKPMPRNGMAQTLLATLHEDVLHTPPPTNYGRAMKDASTLAKAGCTPEEIKGIAEWLLADPFWAPKGVTINRIITRRDEWLASRKVKPSKSNEPFSPTKYLMEKAQREKEEYESSRDNAGHHSPERRLAGEDENPGTGRVDYRSLQMGLD